MSWSQSLFIAHTLLELFLGLIKLRGRYQHEKPTVRSDERSKMYTRHHGASILSLALLGGLVTIHGLEDDETGRIASACLFMFHGGAVVAFAYAWASHNAIPAFKVCVPHLPFALGFGYHYYALQPEPYSS